MSSRSAPSAAALLERTWRPLLLVAWCALLFSLSAREDLRIADDDLLDLVVRKAGHVAAYAVLGVLAAATLRQAGAGERLQLAGGWAFATLYGASDEWHQSMVAGRVGTPRDVVIDAAGAALGIIAWRAWRRHRDGAATEGHEA